MKSKTIKISVAVVVIIVLIILGLRGGEEEMDESTTLVTEDNAVLVVDQPLENSTVVSYAKLSKPGFIIIYDTTVTGEKTVLGNSALLPAGEYTNVVVKHRRSGSSRNKNTNTTTVNVVADNGDGEFTEEDSDVLVAESEVEVNEESDPIEDVTEENIGELLEDEGYVVDEEVSENFDIDENTPEQVEEEAETVTIEETTTTTITIDGDNVEITEEATTTAY